MHLLLDLGLGERRMSSKAYVLRRLGLGGRQLGVMFQDIKLRIFSSEADRIGLDTLAKTMGEGIGGTVAISEADSIEVSVSQSVSQWYTTPTTGHRLTRSRPSPDERVILPSLIEGECGGREVEGGVPQILRLDDGQVPGKLR